MTEQWDADVDPSTWASVDNDPMRIEKLEQIAAVIVTAGLVAGNLVLFAPWRKGQEDRERGRDRSQTPALLWPRTKDIKPVSAVLEVLTHQELCAVGKDLARKEMG